MEEDYWTRFTMTGSVADYLSYREEEKKREGKEQAVKVESYDGKHYGDGHHTVGRSHWGV